MNRRRQTSMPHAEFESKVSASKRSRPTPHTARPLGPIPRLENKKSRPKLFYLFTSIR